MILSDPHIGKSGHFRKAGIPIPQNIFKEDLQRLFSQVTYFKADELIIVGDLFHSHANKEMDLFTKWRKDLSNLNVRLVKGNHDILSKKFYSNAGIEVSPEHFLQAPFCFTHDINDRCDEIADPNQFYTFSGHIHPGIKINGYGKQTLRFPCFYFGHDYAVLPAFSYFTGLATLYPKKSDNVFALVEKNVIKIQ